MAGMFDLLATDPLSRARLGRLTTTRGVIDTPVFMPVGTQASVKALDPRELREMGAQIILGNSYHLTIRPGLEILRAAGGLHEFMSWPGPILTDSGGFQVFSLAKIRKITAHGVQFRSHLDGSPLFLGPKEAMEIQRVLGSDIAMVFDECPPHDCPPKAAQEAVARTLRWAAECREQPRLPGQAVFGIVQGGVNPALREQCARALVEMDFDGYAIGGLSVGEPRDKTLEMIAEVLPLLPKDKPRYVMGVGYPDEIEQYARMGLDMMDCELPTRAARHGLLFTSEGRLNIKSKRYAEDQGPADPACACMVCRRYSRAYLRHLMQAGEALSGTLNTIHNLAYYLGIMERVRASLASGG
jgi:queuine tRNA-ribosyltransferase